MTSTQERRRRSAADRRQHQGPMGPLPERFYPVLHCRCQCGLTVSETAERIGLSSKTVTNYQLDAIEHLGVRTFMQACFRFGCVKRGQR